MRDDWIGGLQLGLITGALAAQTDRRGEKGGEVR